LDHDLAGKVALVTGGSRGIGAAVARALAGAGADVAITYLNSGLAAEKVAAEMRAMGVRTRSVRADQADPAAAAAVVRQVADELGRLDILVNNAAVAVLGPIDGPGPGDPALDRQIRVNYTSVVAAIRAAAHVLHNRGAPGHRRRLRCVAIDAACQHQQSIPIREQRSTTVSTTSDLAQGPGYFTRYKNFALSRSASGVLTVRFHTGGGPHTFDGTTHHDLPRLLDDIAFDKDNRVLVLTGTGDSFIASIDGPSLGDLTKPMGADVLYAEGRRGVQRLADLEIPIIAAVNGPVSVHSEYALLADVVIAADTTVFSDRPHLAFGIAPGDGLFVVWEEVLGLNRARHLEITQGSFTAQQALSWGAVAEVVPLGQVLPRAQELAGQMTQRPHLTNKYMAVIFRQRISRRLAEGTLAGMALEGLTAANLAYLQQG
jgi:enoyl-CoA hydratase/carnithine racemase